MPNAAQHALAAAALARPPYVWDPRLLQPQPMPATSYGQSMSMVSAGPTASGNTVSSAGAPQAQQAQHPMQQQSSLGAHAPPTPMDGASAAAAAAAVQQQNNTAALMSLLANRQGNAAATHSAGQHPYGAATTSAGGGHPAMRPMYMPAASGSAGMPYQHPGMAMASLHPHHSPSAFAMPPPAPQAPSPMPAAALPTGLAPTPAASPTPACAPTPPAASSAVVGPAPTPGGVRAALGPAAYTAARSLMLQQQSTYVQQLFELHKLVQLQQLMACELQVTLTDSTARSVQPTCGATTGVDGLQLVSAAPSSSVQVGKRRSAHPQPGASPSGSEESVAAGMGADAIGPPARTETPHGSMVPLLRVLPAQQPGGHRPAGPSHTSGSSLGNLPKAIRKIAKALPMRATPAPSASNDGAAAMAAVTPTPSVVRPVPLYLVPCEPSGGSPWPATSAQATVQQQLMDVEPASSPDEGASKPRLSDACDGPQALRRGAPPRQPSDELRGLVGNSWRYARANKNGVIGAAVTIVGGMPPAPSVLQRPASRAVSAPPPLALQSPQPHAQAQSQPLTHEPLPHKAREVRGVLPVANAQLCVRNAARAA